MPFLPSGRIKGHVHAPFPLAPTGRLVVGCAPELRDFIKKQGVQESNAPSRKDPNWAGFWHPQQLDSRSDNFIGGHNAGLKKKSWTPSCPGLGPFIHQQLWSITCQLPSADHCPLTAI